MDIDALIAAVYKRSPIWDKRSKLHSNRNVIDKNWKEIAQELNEDETKLRKKWKYIRDQFSVELGKFPPPRSGDSADDAPTSKWPYFKLLLFLKDTVTPRNLKGNLPKVNVCPESSMESQTGTEESMQSPPASEDNSHLNQDEITEIRLSEPNDVGASIIQNTGEKSIYLSSASQSLSKKKRSATEAFNDALLDVEKRKIEYLNAKSQRTNEKEDEHHLFFKSLLSHVKKIPESRILSFRCRVQQLVQEFTAPMDIYQPVPSTENSCASPQSPAYYSNSTQQSAHTISETSAILYDTFSHNY